MIRDEDVAHIVAYAKKDDVPALLEDCLTPKGYKRYPLKGKRHLLGTVNWASPFEPPPKYRCFMLLPEHAGWTTIVDELDRLDVDLARCLSMKATVIAVQGYFELSRYDYTIFDRGVALDEAQIPEAVRGALEFMKSNADHVTRFPYDEVCLRLPVRTDRGSVDFVGYSL